MEKEPEESIVYYRIFNQGLEPGVPTMLSVMFIKVINCFFNSLEITKILFTYFLEFQFFSLKKGGKQDLNYNIYFSLIYLQEFILQSHTLLRGYFYITTGNNSSQRAEEKKLLANQLLPFRLVFSSLILVKAFSFKNKNNVFQK